MFIDKLTAAQKETMTGHAAKQGAEDFMFVKAGEDRPYTALMFTLNGEVRVLRMTTGGVVEEEDRYARDAVIPADAEIPSILLGDGLSPIGSDAVSRFLFDQLYG